MSEGNKYSLLDLGKVPEKVYDDALSPSMKKVGIALGKVVDIVNTLLIPVEYLNTVAKLNFEKNIEKYKQKLNDIPEEKLTEVPSEISFPILERFKYVTNEQLSDAFVKLLSNASDIDSVYSAHPGFISIIDRICPDEAKLLKFLKNEYFIPAIHLKAYTQNATGFYTFKKRTGLEKFVDITFGNNMDVYLDNLESLGLIQNRNFYINQDEKYSMLTELYKNDLDDFKGQLSSEFGEPSWEKECYVITSFCRLFMNACI